MKPYRFIPLALVAILLLLTPTAFAAGTDAGEPVSNQAILTYDVGGVSQPSVSSDDDGVPGNGINPTVFVVDNRVDLTMTGGNNTVVPGSTGQILVFTLENTGNETQGYDIDLFPGTNGAEDDFDMSNVAVYLDNNKDGLVDAGDTLYTVVGGLSNITDVPANAGANSVIQILVVADTPGTATDGDTAAYTLKANTLNAVTYAETTASGGANNPATVDIVLADGDAGAGVGGSTDGANNGDYLASGTYTVQAASIAVTKSATVTSDPINLGSNPKAIPGATVQYSIEVTNTGASAADNVVLTDPIPTYTDFVVGTVSDSSGTGTIAYDNGTGTWSYAPVAGANGADPNVSHVRISIPTIAGSGGSVTITFDVLIE